MRGLLFIPGNVIAVGSGGLAKKSPSPYSYSLLADASGKAQEVLMTVEG
jgi:hypothetical protein